MTSRSSLLLPLSFLWLLSACTFELQHDVTEDDANDIYVLLQRHGIVSNKAKEEGGNEPRYLITVSKQDAASAAELLRENSLPRPVADGLSVFKKNKAMIPTQTEERGMLLEALAGEVSNALNRIPNVLDARVIITMPESTDLTQPDQKPTASASVLLKYRNSEDGKAPVNEVQLKNFVSMAVPDMRPERVTVLLALVEQGKDDNDPKNLLQDIVGFRMTQESAGKFKWMVALGVLVIVALAGLTAWNFLKGGGISAGRNSRGSSSEAE